MTQKEKKRHNNLFLAPLLVNQDPPSKVKNPTIRTRSAELTVQFSTTAMKKKKKTIHSHQYFLLSLLLLSFSSSTSSSFSSSSSYSLIGEPKEPPPLPILPIPSASQLQWQMGKMAMFLHFGPNTFTDSEWGTGHADPSVFNPSRFNAAQWVRVAKDSGFSRVILTAKHHDGFCLWPSAYTDYSVRSSAWLQGSGDVVGDLAAAARDAGLGLGLYLSPWDRHERTYGKTLDYNEFYVAQMTELLTRSLFFLFICSFIHLF